MPISPDSSQAYGAVPEAYGTFAALIITDQEVILYHSVFIYAAL